MPKYESSVFKTELTTLKFSKDLSILFEKTDNIDLAALKKFLDHKNNIKTPLKFGSCVKFIFPENEIAIRGYKLNEAWIASEMSSEIYRIPICVSIEEIIIALEYYYHMSTVI